MQDHVKDYSPDFPVHDVKNGYTKVHCKEELIRLKQISRPSCEKENYEVNLSPSVELVHMY